MVEETEGASGVIFAYLLTAVGEKGGEPVTPLVLAQQHNNISICSSCEHLPSRPIYVSYYLFVLSSGRFTLPRSAIHTCNSPSLPLPHLCPLYTHLHTPTGAAVASVLLQPAVHHGVVSVSLGASGAIFGLFAVSVLTRLSWDPRKLLEGLILGNFVVRQVLNEAQAQALGGRVVGGLQVGMWC